MILFIISFYSKVVGGLWVKSSNVRVIILNFKYGVMLIGRGLLYISTCILPFVFLFMLSSSDKILSKELSLFLNG